MDRRTRGVDVLSSYLPILSRRTREEREREINPEPESIQQRVKVLSNVFELIAVHCGLERTYNPRER